MYTRLVQESFGWTTSSVEAVRLVLISAHVEHGELTAAATQKTCQLPATSALSQLQSLRYNPLQQLLLLGLLKRQQPVLVFELMGVNNRITCIPKYKSS